MRRTLQLCMLVALTGAGCGSCPRSRAGADAGPLAFAPPADTVRLPIADRPWAEGAPAAGWCGEASVQMVALHFGAWVPQRTVNALGRPAHEDLWEDDVPTALDALGLQHERWKADAGAIDDFLRWTVAHLRGGHPVIIGLKLYPTGHPDWDVDHLVPVVGYTPQGLVLNTNLAPGQVHVPWAALRERSAFSLVNASGRLSGVAVRGFTLDGGAVAASLRVVDEMGPTLELHTDGLDGARRWAVRREELGGATSLEPFRQGMTVQVPAPSSAAVRFTVVPVNETP